ncbi:MAG: transposase, partial [Actinomycetota bacterium]|nr:transposase [Actinomycetota bacterium]
MFIDESALHTSMSRLRARAPRGERAYGQGVQRNRGNNQTLIGCVTLERGTGAAVSIEGSTGSELLETYVEEVLAPTFTAGQLRPFAG